MNYIVNLFIFNKILHYNNAILYIQLLNKFCNIIIVYVYHIIFLKKIIKMSGYNFKSTLKLVPISHKFNKVWIAKVKMAYVLYQ